MVTRRVRRITWQDNVGNERWLEGDASAWRDEGYAIAFHGRETIRIPKNRIVNDREYDSFSLCFISTAVYTNIGFDDDCSDLVTLRHYRDNYLLKTPNGKKLVEDYYSIAPMIVNQIEKLENKNQIYCNIYDQHLKNIIFLINNNEYESARLKYQEMVNELSVKFKSKILINN